MCKPIKKWQKFVEPLIKRYRASRIQIQDQIDKQSSNTKLIKDLSFRKRVQLCISSQKYKIDQTKKNTFLNLAFVIWKFKNIYLLMVLWNIFCLHYFYLFINIFSFLNQSNKQGLMQSLSGSEYSIKKNKNKKQTKIKKGSHGLNIRPNWQQFSIIPYHSYHYSHW